MTFEEKMRANLVQFIVQRQIFCTLTQEVLDVRTCVVVLDTDGDPHAVFSPNGYRRIVEIAERTGVDPIDTLAPGFTWDQSTIPA